MGRGGVVSFQSNALGIIGIIFQRDVILPVTGIGGSVGPHGVGAFLCQNIFTQGTGNKSVVFGIVARVRVTRHAGGDKDGVIQCGEVVIARTGVPGLSTCLLEMVDPEVILPRTAIGGVSGQTGTGIAPVHGDIGVGVQGGGIDPDMGFPCSVPPGNFIL